MSYDDNKRLVAGFGGGMLRLWGIAILVFLTAALFAISPWVAVAIGVFMVLLIAAILISSRREAKTEADALEQTRANETALAEGRLCHFIRANGKQCVHGATVGDFCPRHAAMQT